MAHPLPIQKNRAQNRVTFINLKKITLVDTISSPQFAIHNYSICPDIITSSIANPINLVRELLGRHSKISQGRQYVKVLVTNLVTGFPGGQVVLYLVTVGTITVFEHGGLVHEGSFPPHSGAGLFGVSNVQFYRWKNLQATTPTLAASVYSVDT